MNSYRKVTMMNTPPVSRALVSQVGTDYFEMADHRAAMEVGADFVNAFLRLAVDFPNIGVVQVNGRDFTYRLDVGFLTIDEAKEVTRNVDALMDELQAFREKRPPSTPKLKTEAET